MECLTVRLSCPWDMMSLQQNAVFSKRNSFKCVQDHRLKSEEREASEKKEDIKKGRWLNLQSGRYTGLDYARDKWKAGMIVVVTTH